MMDIIADNNDCVTIHMDDDPCMVDSEGVAFPLPDQTPAFLTRVAAEIANIRKATEELLSENARLRAALTAVDPQNEALQ